MFRFALIAALLFAAVAAAPEALAEPTPAETPAKTPAATTATAIFAGGCFWCVEADFDKLDGVISTTSGYDGGTSPDPTYEQVSAGHTGYAEVVRIVYNPQKVTYPQLLDYFWQQIDPVDASGQFCDRGLQYRSAIFYVNEVQKQQALESKCALEGSGRLSKPVATAITPSTHFYAAEDYHQDFYKKNSLRYHTYRLGCGRDARLRVLWRKPVGGDPS